MVTDITCAFLHASMRGEPPLYVVIPEGLGPPGYRGILRVALYGSRRASFLWGETAAKGMQKAGMKRLKGCGQVFVHREKELMAAIHGDDVISGGPKSSQQFLAGHLEQEFRVKLCSLIGPGCELSSLFFLNREIRHHPDKGYSWHPNPRHATEVIEELGLQTAKPVAAPGVRDGGPAIREAENLLSAADVAIYMRCVGKLIYLSVDRFDIAFVVRLLAQALREPRQRNLLQLRHLAKYLAGTLEWAIEYAFQPPGQLLGYSDSDWATCKITRRSVSSGLVMLGGSSSSAGTGHFLTGWVSGQSVVALSSGEAEYYALCRLVAELLFCVFLFKEAYEHKKALARTDSSAAKGMAGRSGSGSVKHIDIKHLWLQEVVRSKQVHIEKWPGADNPADLGTKVLLGEVVRRLSPRTGLVPVPFSAKTLSSLLRQAVQARPTQSLRILLMAVLLSRARGAEAQEEPPAIYVGEVSYVLSPYGLYVSWAAALQVLFYLLLLLGTLAFGRTRWERLAAQPAPRVEEAPEEDTRQLRAELESAQALVEKLLSEGDRKDERISAGLRQILGFEGRNNELVLQIFELEESLTTVRRELALSQQQQQAPAPPPPPTPAEAGEAAYRLHLEQELTGQQLGSVLRAAGLAYSGVKRAQADRVADHGIHYRDARPTKAQIIYVAASMRRGAPLADITVFQSTDECRNWLTAHARR